MGIEYYQITTKLDDETLIGIKDLCHKIFGFFDAEDFTSHLNNALSRLVIIAKLDGEIIGFKAGYAMNNKIFFSWLGGVNEDYRRTGIGQHMMSLQHEWCQKNQFNAIQTHTSNQWVPMIILNLVSGLKITGTFMDQKSRLKIVMEKLF